jgi:16S rRNA processing protein RimM
MTEPVHVATIVTTRGNRGEVAAVCPGGHPQRLAGLRSVLVAAEGDVPARREVTRAWRHGNRLILQFSGVDSIQAAESLVGWKVYLPEEELPELPEGQFYTFRLLGAAVVDRHGRRLGRVVDTEEAPAQDLLVVETPDGRRALVPMTLSIVTEIDAEGGRIVVDPPEGLLEGEPEVVEGSR